MTALVATLAAALFGTADFLGGLTSRRMPATRVTAVSQTCGFLVLAMCSIAFPPAAWGDGRILWGAVAGVSGGLGVLALYAGLGTGRMSIVAPIAAALSGSIPAAFGMAVRHQALSGIRIAGIVLALLAVIIVSSTTDDDATGSGAKAVILAVLAGCGFAGSLISYAQTPVDTSLAPLALARCVTVLMLVGIMVVTRLGGGGREDASGEAPGAGIGGRAVLGLVCIGVVDAIANIAQVAAIRMGPLAVATVLGGLYPVATLLLARFILHERLHGWQRAGIALSLVAVLLTSASA